MVVRETVSFVFPRVLMFPERKSRKKLILRIPGKTKPTSLLRGHTLSPLIYLFRLSLKQSYSNDKNMAEHLCSQSSILLDE